MTVRVYSNPNPLPTAKDIINADGNKAGLQSISMKREHRDGDTVDKGDQVSGVTLFGFAIVGASVMLVAHWLIS